MELTNAINKSIDKMDSKIKKVFQEQNLNLEDSLRLSETISITNHFSKNMHILSTNNKNSFAINKVKGISDEEIVGLCDDGIIRIWNLNLHLIWKSPFIRQEIY